MERKSWSFMKYQRGESCRRYQENLEVRLVMALEEGSKRKYWRDESCRIIDKSHSEISYGIWTST